MSEPQHTLESLETNWNNAIKLSIKRTKERDEALEQLAAVEAERDQLHTALTSIRCIAMGRDGQADAAGLGALVDELYAIASKAVAPLAYAEEMAAGDAQGSKAYKSERDTLSAKVTHLTNALEAEQAENEALAARVEELTAFIRDLSTNQHKFWTHYSMVTEGVQDELHTQKEMMLEGLEKAPSVAASRALASQSAQQAVEGDK